MRRGDAVALSVGNRIEHLEIIFATAKIGALAIPLDVKWKALELAAVVAALERDSSSFRKIVRKNLTKRKNSGIWGSSRLFRYRRTTLTADCSAGKARRNPIFTSMKTIHLP